MGHRLVHINTFGKVYQYIVETSASNSHRVFSNSQPSSIDVTENNT